MLEEIDEADAAARLTHHIEECAERWLRPFMDRLRAHEVQPRPKVINDALWGSIRLFQWEVAILDTWLLQRLRHLRQLGVVHWVYPGGAHSRLEHSLGVVHQMEALLTGIQRRGTPALDDANHKLLRLAALLHDSGHSIMCHVSETFINDQPGVLDLRNKLQDEFRSRQPPSASEAFAAVFVQSPAFRELLAMPAVGASFVRDTTEATRRIAGFIIGAPVLPDAAYLTLLLNGAFDADKLDYMPRDSMMTGVPCAVDVRRVIETVRVLNVPIASVEGYAAWAGVDKNAASIAVLTLTGAGGRALGELAIARSLLYEKVYFHHKVRALEAMVRRALSTMKQRPVSQWLDLVDDDLLVGPTAPHFQAIRRRELLKRCLVLTQPDDDSPNAQPSGQADAWRELMGDGEHARLSKELFAESCRVAGYLGISVDSLERQPPEVDAPPIRKIGLDQPAFVGDSVEEFDRATVSFSGQRSEGGRRAAQQCIYIFAPESAVLPVFVAARRLLKKNYGFEVRPEAYRTTRLDPEIIATAEATLAEKGYFGDDLPPPIAPSRIQSHREEALETLIRTARPRLEELAVRFGQYQPFDEAPISPERIAAFLRQFETERLARSALLLLEAIDFKDRRFFSSALRNRLKLALSAGVVCPLGAGGDSSAFISYLMNDLEAELKREVVPIELALDDDAPGGGGDIILWDDLCGRAGHAATTIAQWLQLPKLDGDLLLDEALVRPLSAARAARFRERNVVLAFALARASGLDELRKFLARHELQRVSVLPAEVEVPEENRAFGTADVIPDDDDRRDLQTFLEARMRVALGPNHRRSQRAWNEAKLSSRLLGYGGESHLIVFSYNVPTITLTALWTQGPGWNPLFVRRGKVAP